MTNMVEKVAREIEVLPVPDCMVELQKLIESARAEIENVTGVRQVMTAPDKQKAPGA